jgi:nitrate reductase beta subunit
MVLESDNCPVIQVCSVKCRTCFTERAGCHYFDAGRCLTYKNVFLNKDNNSIYFIKKTLMPKDKQEG